MMGCNADDPRNKLLLLLIFYTFSVAIVQIIYMVLVGTFPFNSFLSGFFCHLGLFVISVSLHLHLNLKNTTESAKRQAFFDFVFSCLALFFVVFSFIG